MNPSTPVARRATRLVSPLAADLVALAATAAAVALRALLDPLLGDELALVTLYGPVALAVWLGGIRPAAIAAIVGYLACDYLFIEPRGHIELDSHLTLVRAASYLVSCAIIVGFGAAMRRAHALVDAHRVRLEREVGVREAAEALADARHEQLRVTLLSIGDGVIVTDAQARVRLLNPVAEQLTGWSRADAEGRTLAEVFRIVDEKTRQPVPSPAERVLREGVVVGLANHTLLLARDGREVPIDDSGAPIFKTGGAIDGVVLVFRDVTERRRAEVELQRSEEELRDLFDHASIAMHWVDGEGRILRVNDAELALTGYARDEYVGRNLAEVHADAGALGEILRRLNDGETLREYPARLRRKDGEIRDVLIHSNAAFRDGRFAHTRCFTLDVTDRKRALAALAESERRLSLAQQVARIGTFDWNMQADVNRWTPELEAMYGLPPGGFGGTLKAWAELVHPEDLPAAERMLEASLETGTFEGEWRVRWADGSTHWLAGRGSVLRDAQGRPERLIGVNIDVTERRLAEEALRDAALRKDEFLAMLGHELRNPLGPIVNAVEILETVGAKSDEAQTVRGMIRRQAAHMTRLVDDLLDVSRIARGKVALRRERCDLAALVRDAAEDQRRALDGAGLALDLELPAEPLWIDGDPTRVSQIVDNLLNNAIKFSDPGGRIAVALAAEGGRARLRVRDTGIGMDAATLARAFDPFVQADVSLERARGGLGLGLALVRGWAELHGGAARASSGGPGRGSELEVDLPLAAAAQAEPAPQAAAPAPSMPLRVLVIEDNLDAAASLEMLLRLSGHTTRVAHGGSEGVEAAKDFRPDVVMCDIGLPGMDGFAVARALREDPALSGNFLIALTGYGQDADKERTKAASFDLHLVKPVDYEAVRTILAQVARRDARGAPA